MNLKALAVAAVAIVGATPASAALQTVNFTGSWLYIVPTTTSWAPTDQISMSVTYDDTAYSATYGFAYDIIGPGASLTLTIGSQQWTLADHFNAFGVAVPFITFALPTGPEVFFTASNATPTGVITGASFLGSPPGFGVVGELGNGFSGDTSDFVLSVAGVPEPANWAMLIAGFGLTGAVMRRRRMAIAA
jgi:hypothetical protein